MSQFTLLADSRRQKGNRPDFSGAALREQAEPLYQHFCGFVSRGRYPLCRRVSWRKDGRRGLVNDGPVTFILET